MPDTETLRAAALSYAAAGIHVFPVLAGRKEPATANGVKDATTDPAKIAAWWSQYPYNIGLRTGPESRLFVVDVDPRNGGEWESPVPTTAARTGGGGTHYYFRWPAGVAKMRRTLKTGVDVQGKDKYVVAPPSVVGNPYEWLSTEQPADAPLDVLAEIAIPEGTVTDTRPGDRFNAERTWREVLEPYGWKVDHEDGAGVTYWTRPGKEEGISATTNYQDSDLLYVFSTSTDFEADRGYDKFGAYSVLEYGGDIEAAAAALAGPSLRLTGSGVTPAATGSIQPPVASPASALVAGYSYPTPPDHLLTQYIHYGGMLTDAAPEYHEAAGLALLAVLTSGVRVALSPYPEGLSTNLYIALVGASSLSRKSTAQAIARTFVRLLRPNALLPDRATGEMLIQELSQRRVALWMPDELGVQVAEIYNRGGYLQAIEQVLLTLYGSRDYRYQTLGRGETAITNLDFSILGAATPESFAGTGRALVSGLLPRFGVVYPRQLPPPRPPVLMTTEHQQWREGLAQRMRQVLDFCTTPGNSRAVTMTPDALAVLGGLDQEFGHASLTARLVTAAYKVTALVALADLRLEATVADANAAVAITRRWAAGAHNLRRFLGRLPADVQHMEQVGLAKSELRTMDATVGTDGRRVVSMRDFARLMSMPASSLKKLLETMESTGDVLLVVNEGEEEIHFAG